MPSKAKTVAEYLAELPADRRTAIEAVRKVILANVGPDLEEGIAYGMIGYCIPHRIYPAGYHCNPAQPVPYAALASQKGYMSLHLMFCYGNDELTQWLGKAFAKAGHKLDMGKTCLRFTSLADLPLDVLAQLLRKAPWPSYLERYEALIARGKSGTSPSKRKAAPRQTSQRGNKPRPRGAQSKQAPATRAATKKPARTPRATGGTAQQRRRK